MKLKYKYFLCGIFILLIFLFFKIQNFDLIIYKKETINKHSLKVVHDNFIKKKTEVEHQITLILPYNSEPPRRFAATLNSFLFEFPLMPVIIVSENPLSAEVYSYFSNSSGIINIPLKLDLLNLVVDRHTANHIRTKYLFIAPTRIIAFSLKEGLHLIKLLNELKEDFIAIPAKGENIECLKLKLNLLQWTIQYQSVKNNSEENCDTLIGDHGILMKSESFQKIGEPFMLPFPEAFYIQTTFLNLSVKVVHSIRLKPKFPKAKIVSLKNNLERQNMNRNLKIKKIIRQDGTVEWYGCTRKTQRCFPTMTNAVPEYIRQGRWTPPCCLNILQETARYVFKELKRWNVTFWLEGGTLLGAMRMKDIIPWDQDVDIGIYLKDINKCPWLKTINSRTLKQKKTISIVDNNNFVWEKVNPYEGDFFRVQAGVFNKLHVDIFPFFSKNGIMTKKTWFKTHSQDKEFPEHYLKPLTTIEFAGVEAPAPNNVKEFLEFKFGKGCVENPQYPLPKVYPFPEHAKHLVINDVNNYNISTFA